MSEDGAVSDHCLLDHGAPDALDGTRPDIGRVRKSPGWILRAALLALDRKMHFQGVRGRAWRALGVVRSARNPNICNM